MWWNIFKEYIHSTKRNLSEMTAMVKATQESQFKGKMHMNKLQESVDFISAKFDEYEKHKK